MTEVTNDRPKKVRNCGYEPCGKEYTYTLESSRFCSGKCRVAWNKEEKLKNATVPLAPMAKGFDMQGLAGLQQALFAIPPHAQMMIDHHKKEADRWETVYNDEKKKRESAEQQYKELKDTTERADKPKGLQGFVQSNQEICLELVKTFGPTINKIMESKAPAQIAGAPDVDENAKLFLEWLPKNSADTQGALWKLIQTLSQLEEPKLVFAISNILNYLNGNANPRQTGTYE